MYNCQGVFFSSRRPWSRDRGARKENFSYQVDFGKVNFSWGKSGKSEIAPFKDSSGKKRSYGEITLIHKYVYISSIFIYNVYNMYTSSANLEIGMVPQIRKLLSFFVFLGGASFNGLHFGYFGSSRVLLSICFSGKLTGWKITEF